MAVLNPPPPCRGAAWGVGPIPTVFQQHAFPYSTVLAVLGGILADSRGGGGWVRRTLTDSPLVFLLSRLYSYSYWSKRLPAAYERTRMRRCLVSVGRVILHRGYG